MSEKKYIGSGFKGNFEGQNIEISIPQLAKALGLEVNKLKSVFSELYKDGKFTTPALYVKTYKNREGIEVKDLTLRIQTAAKKDYPNAITVALNEWVKEEKPQQQPTAPVANELAPQSDDLPF